nr:hypothetical protein [Chryseolinea sp.]
NLFGKFFADRAEFFVINKPTNTLHGSSIQSITLFYLDGQLSKTKYVVADNIAENLVQQFGSFTITGLDQHNKSIIASHTVMIENGIESKRLNPQLDNFEMTWKKGSSQIKYRASKANAMDRYTYTERLSNYEQAYRSVEASVN